MAALLAPGLDRNDAKQHGSDIRAGIVARGRRNHFHQERWHLVGFTPLLATQFVILSPYPKLIGAL